jgi:protease IV
MSLDPRPQSTGPNTPQSQTLAKALVGLCIVSALVGIFQLATGATHKPVLGKDSVIGHNHTPDGSGGAMVSWLGNNAIRHDHYQLIELSGPISMEGGEAGPSFLRSETNAVSVRKALDEAAEDDWVKGVLLRIDSPGGTVGMSQELNAAVQRVRAVKPIVASLGDVAASGGYYTACATDKIVANPGTLTGSIGVIMSTLNLKGLVTDKLGVKAVTIKSGKFKDLLSPLKDTNPDEVALLQHLIGVSYQQFLHAVIEGRTRLIKTQKDKTALTASITAVADGRVLVGTDAKAVGLVDDIGDLTTAHQLLDNLAKARFNQHNNKRLPLEEDRSGGQGLLDTLGLSNEANLLIKGLTPNSTNNAGGLSSVLPKLPFSLTHTQQPLWMLE